MKWRRTDLKAILLLGYLLTLSWARREYQKVLPCVTKSTVVSGAVPWLKSMALKVTCTL